MKKRATATIAWLSVFVSFISLSSPLALAATPPAKTPPTPPNNNAAGQALEISPPVMTLNADPGGVIKTQISIRDVSSSALVVNGNIDDFVAAGEDGTPKLLLDDTTSPYSIKGWVSKIPQMVLQPRQIVTIPLTITVPANASPGGHYGVIRFTAVPPNMESTGVSLSASLGSLILITISGNVTEKLEIEELSVSKDGKKGTLFQSAPLDFTERIKNTGNVHEQPTGQVEIINMFGKKIGAVNVNLPPRNILPASTRKFTQPFDHTVIGTRKLFGKYTAKMKLTYGAKKQTVEKSITFWVIPYRLVAAVIIGIIIAIILLIFLIRRYNSHIIGRSHRRRR